TLASWIRPKHSSVAPPIHSHARRPLLARNASDITAIHTGNASSSQGSVVRVMSPGHSSATRPMIATVSGRPSSAAASDLAHIVVDLADTAARLPRLAAQLPPGVEPGQ